MRSYDNHLYSGFCEKTSNGYLFYIKNKYPEKFTKDEIPKIINNFNRKTRYWIFYNVNAQISDNKKIILNNKNDIDFEKYKIIDEYENKCFFIEKND